MRQSQLHARKDVRVSPIQTIRSLLSTSLQRNFIVEQSVLEKQPGEESPLKYSP